MESSDKFRVHVEEKLLMDRGQNMREKYGAYRGWKMGLRHDASIDAILEYTEQCGGPH